MNAWLPQLAEHPLTEVVGWTLIHFLWQGLLVAVLAAGLLACFRSASASARYLVACSGLALLAMAPLVTAVYLSINYAESGVWQRADESRTKAIEFSNDLAAHGEPGELHSAIPVAGDLTANEPISLSGPTSSAEASAGTSWRQWLRNSFPYFVAFFVAFWLGGVILLSLRLLGGLWRVSQWRRGGLAVESSELKQMVANLSTKMSLKKHFKLLESAQATVPAVIGWLKPAVIVPTSLISGLTPAELESLLAHELAHIQRHDYLVNLLQTVIETLLFYHPAVWWLSRIIRQERENCCDDMAVAACGNRIVFARALTKLEELRCGDPKLALSANGGSLLGRIQRLLTPVENRNAAWWPAGAWVLASIALMLSSLFLAAAMAKSEAQEHQEHQETQEMSIESQSSTELVLQNESWTAADETYQTRKAEMTIQDSKTGIDQRVLNNILLATVQNNQWRRAKLAMKYSNVFSYSLIPARIAKDLNAQELGEIDFGTRPLANADPLQTNWVVGIEQPADPELAEPKIEKVRVHELTEPLKPGQQVVPYADEPVFLPHHLAFYGMNPKDQHKFRIVRIDKVALGVGPPFGPINALVLDDQNSDFGLLGADWVQQVRGEKGEGLWFFFAESAFHFMAHPQDNSQPQEPLSVPAPPQPQAEAEAEAKESKAIPLTVVEQDNGVIKRVELLASKQGRSPKELWRKWNATREANRGPGASLTDAETLVSATQSPRWIGNGVDADEIIFSLPEGSEMRAEFLGEKVEILENGSQTSVVVTNGKVQLLDQGGVVRAWASADSGAEQVIADVRLENQEFVIRLSAKRLVDDPKHIPHMQCATFPETGGPQDEKQPPHGAVRYAVQKDLNNRTFRLKVLWRYDVDRIRQEANNDDPMQQADNRSDQTFETETLPTIHKSIEWGSTAEVSGLQSRLILKSERPVVGQPLLFKLELRNAGEKPSRFDPQHYAPFRVLRAMREDGKRAPFIGMGPQTSGQLETLQPGEASVLWKDVDAAELFLLTEGKYQFLAEGGEWAMQPLWRDSNTVKVEIQPGKLPPQKSLLKTLIELELKPQDWSVSTGFGAIYLSHSPTNLKSDVTTIQLWFTEEPLPADYQLGNEKNRQVVTTIAPCELGYLHVAALPKAKELWPEYVRDIRIAAARVLNFNAKPRAIDKTDDGSDGDYRAPRSETILELSGTLSPTGG